MPIYPRQNQLDEAIQRMLDNEACAKIMPSPPSVTATSMSASPTSVSSESHSAITSSRAKSPLSQAMLQIHSPSSVPDISAGETVVLQMEEGRATLIAHPDGRFNAEKAASTAVNKSTCNSDSDDVFDHEKVANKADAKGSASLQNVLSNLISSQVVSLSQEEAARKDASPLGSMENRKNCSENGESKQLVLPVAYKSGSPSPNKGGNTHVADVLAGRASVSPVAVGNKSAISGSRKSQTVEISVPSVGSPVTSSSPGTTVSPGATHERKKTNRSTSKVPHPAFNIPINSVEKMNSSLYNYNLPDRGLGSMMTSSPIPVTVSPPAVTVPRFPANVTAQLPGQVLNFVSPQWPITVGHSPASNESRSSGSPLDLSAVREPSPKLVKSKNVKEVQIKPHWVSEKPISVQKQPVVNQVLPQVLAEKVSTAEKPPVKSDATRESPPTTSASKVPYTKEMLYLFDKELEIISVGKNKWIIRNENELVNVVKRNSESDPVTSGHNGCNNCADQTTCANSVKCSSAVLTQNGDSPNGTEINKRPFELEENSPRSKITKLVNGDIHSKDESVSTRGVVHVTGDVTPHSGDSVVTMPT